MSRLRVERTSGSRIDAATRGWPLGCGLPFEVQCKVFVVDDDGTERELTALFDRVEWTADDSGETGRAVLYAKSVDLGARQSGCFASCARGRHVRRSCPNACGARVDCGGSCCLDRRHTGDHECVGDNPGEPGSCPA
jgi:hypothetical protein